MEQKKVYAFKIDEDGYIIGSLLVAPNELGDNKVITPIPPDVIFKAKWTGTKWVEGATEEEIAEYTKVEPSPLSQEERIRELESIVNLLLMGGL